MERGSSSRTVPPSEAAPSSTTELGDRPRESWGMTSSSVPYDPDCLLDERNLLWVGYRARGAESHELRAQLRDALSLIEGLQIRIDGLHQDLSISDTLVQDQARELESRDSRIDRQREVLERERARNRNLSVRMAQIRATSDERAETIAQMTHQIEHRDANLDDLHQQLGAMEQFVTQLQERADQAEEQVGALLAHIAEMEPEDGEAEPMEEGQGEGEILEEPHQPPLPPPAEEDPEE